MPFSFYFHAHSTRLLKFFLLIRVTCILASTNGVVRRVDVFVGNVGTASLLTEEHLQQQHSGKLARAARIKSKTRFSPFGDPVLVASPMARPESVSLKLGDTEFSDSRVRRAATILCGIGAAVMLPLGFWMILFLVKATSVKATSAPVDRKVFAYILVFSVQVVFAVYQLLSKVALSAKGLDPLGFSFVRTVGTSLVLFLIGSVTDGEKSVYKRVIAGGHVPQFLLLGAYMAANILGWMYALKYTSSAIVAVLQVLCPIIASVISWMLGKEAFSFKMLLGIALCTVGTSTITMQSAMYARVDESPAPCLGIAFVFIHAMGQALYIIHQSTLLDVGFSTFTINAGSFMVASAIMGMLMLLPSSEYHSGMWWDSSPYCKFNLVYSIVLAGAFSHSTMGWAAKEIGGTAVMLFMLLQAVLTMIGGKFVLNEHVNVIQILGAILVLVGLAFYIMVKEPLVKDDPLKG